MLIVYEIVNKYYRKERRSGVVMKNLLIACIHRYQKKAPYYLRASCRYEPTCSEYMILAIKKYGCIRGVYKGILRLFRCKPPNGGVDYP